jgi:hypothetical protein
MVNSVARGTCLCGAVRFGAALPSKWVAHCHCSFCRRAHGAAFVTWAGFPAGQVKVDADAQAPTWYASSPGAWRGVCGRCGSPIFCESERWPDETHVARALFIDELDCEPSAHVYRESHVPWLELGNELPKKVRQAALVVPPATATPTPSSDGPVRSTFATCRTTPARARRPVVVACPT